MVETKSRWNHKDEKQNVKAEMEVALMVKEWNKAVNRRGALRCLYDGNSEEKAGSLCAIVVKVNPLAKFKRW